MLNIETKGKTPPYFHQGMFLCSLVILMHGKVDNDLKIASSSCRHVFIFVKSIKSNILVEISLTTCFFFRRPPLGLTLWQRHVIWWVQISKIQNTKYKYTCSIIIIQEQNEERKLKHPFYSLTMTSPISYVLLNFHLMSRWIFFTSFNILNPKWTPSSILYSWN